MHFLSDWQTWCNAVLRLVHQISLCAMHMAPVTQFSYKIFRKLRVYSQCTDHSPQCNKSMVITNTNNWRS